MKIRLYKDWGVNLCLVILYYTLFIGFITYNFGVPESALYLEDALLVLLFVMRFQRLTKAVLINRLRFFGMTFLLLLMMGAVVSFAYDPKIHMLIWSIRNWGRGILYFYFCCTLLDKKIIDRVIRAFLWIYRVNVFVILIQYFFLRENYTQDSLNGLFGRGTSSVNLTVTMIVLVIVLSMWFSGHISLKQLIVRLIEVNVVSAVSELKAVFIIEIMMICVYALVNSKTNMQQIMKYAGITLITLVVVILGASVLSKVYPWFADFLSVDVIISIVNSEHGYGFWGYIDRLNFISVINKHLFGESLLKSIVGIGLGSAEYSAVAAFCSDFYYEFGKTFRYLLFSSSVLYVETGMIGLGLFTLAHSSLFTSGWKRIKKSFLERERLLYENIGVGVAFISVICIFYNNVHRTDFAVILSFFCAIPIAMEYKGCYSSDNHTPNLGE